MKLKISILFGILLLGILTACGPKTVATPTEAPEAIYTRVAATVQMNMTQTALAMPTSTPTLEPTAMPTATSTVIPLPTIPQGTSLTALPTLTGMPTLASQPTQSNVPLRVTSQSPIDGTILAPVEEFMLYWRLQNTSSTTWTKDYYVGWFSGAQIWGITKVTLDTDVAPGKFVEVYVHGTAPEAVGEYITRWALYTSGGQFIYEVNFHFFVQK
jgi:hypothetical protein